VDFIINCTELAMFAAATEKVAVTAPSLNTEVGYCQNCRDNCDSWCTQMYFSAPTKNPPSHP